MKMKVTVRCKSAEQIIRAHGLDRNGDVQRFWTNIVNRRISRYMPYLSLIHIWLWRDIPMSQTTI